MIAAIPIPDHTIGTAWPRRGLPALRPVANRICRQSSEAFGVEVADIRGRRRAKGFCAARHWVWQELRRAGYSFPEIAREFSVDHSSVQYACAKGGI